MQNVVSFFVVVHQSRVDNFTIRWATRNGAQNGRHLADPPRDLCVTYALPSQFAMVCD